MIRKFLTSVAVAGLAAGAANAVGLTNGLSETAADDPYLLADAVDFTGLTTTPNVGVGPSAGSFPTGNVLIFVDVAGAEFNGALDGTEFSGPGVTSVISTGGLDEGTSVTFLASGIDGCGTGLTDCDFDIPLTLSGGADVTISVGIETDAGAPVDNSSETNQVDLDLIQLAPAFSITITPDGDPPVATLAAPSPFTAFAGNNDLGDVLVDANAVMLGGGTPTVNIDLAGNDVDAGDATSVDILLEGNMAAFDPANGGDVTFGGTSFDDVDSTDDEAEYDAIADFGSSETIELDPDTTTPIERSNYDVTVTITPAASLTAGATASGAVDPVTRDGTAVVFPWTQSSTQGAASGTTSVFRIGNLDASATGAVFAEVRNASEAGFVNPGIIQLASEIPAGGEYVTTSSALETALGNYGRGDVEFTVEANPDELTGRQFVVRGDVIQQVSGGNIDQDLAD
jgi:hypothetical protein